MSRVLYTSPGFGGNSKCWLGGTTRMMPGDFKLKSRYGVGVDWPVSYDDLEAHYCTVEEVMRVSGPADSPMPRSKPVQMPPHRFSDPDALLKKRYPDGWFNVSTSRASVPTGNRGVCCATGVCELCPVDAKFTVQNGLAHLYKDPRVTLQLQSEVATVDTAAGIAKGVTYLREGREQSATADLVVLAASALFNPHILLRSGITHPLLGKRWLSSTWRSIRPRCTRRRCAPRGCCRTRRSWSTTFMPRSGLCRCDVGCCWSRRRTMPVKSA